jgi:GNAT superfamily N-acetyltransferase
VTVTTGPEAGLRDYAASASAAGLDAGPSAGPAAGVRVRRAHGDDRAALDAMFLRCTPQTVYRRFHGPVKAFPAAYLTEALAGAPAHLALVAVAGLPAGADLPAGAGQAARDWEGATVVALASCRLTDSGTAAELGLLVEDALQGQGIGRELLRRLVAYADCLKLAELQAQVLIEQGWIVGMLRPYGECSSAFRQGVREVRVRRDAR